MRRQSHLGRDDDFDGHPGSGGVSASPNHRVEIERGERELSLPAGVRGQPRRGRCAIHRIGRVAAEGRVTHQRPDNGIAADADRNERLDARCGARDGGGAP